MFPEAHPRQIPYGAGALAGNTLDDRSPSAVLQACVDLFINCDCPAGGRRFERLPILLRDTQEARPMFHLSALDPKRHEPGGIAPPRPFSVRTTLASKS